MYSILIAQLKETFFLPRMPQHQKRQFVVHEPRATKMQFRSSVLGGSVLLLNKVSLFVCFWPDSYQLHLLLSHFKKRPFLLFLAL